jgi:hypothetical protein
MRIKGHNPLHDTRTNAEAMSEHGELYGGVFTEPKRKINSRGNAGFSRCRVLVRVDLPDGTSYTYWKPSHHSRGSIIRGGLY